MVATLVSLYHVSLNEFAISIMTWGDVCMEKGVVVFLTLVGLLTIDFFSSLALHWACLNHHLGHLR